MHLISADKLDSLVRDILLGAGADERNANRVAEALVSANLSGVDTHGVLHLPRYVDEIKAGNIVPTNWPEVLKEMSNSALVTGNWTFGHVVAKFVMELAIQKATEHEMSVVSMVRSNHIGRLGEYAEMAAAQGMMSFVWASGYSEETPVAVPYGGRKPVLHTNPLAMGFPSGQEPAVVLDFATTTVAGSKVIQARRGHRTLPSGALVDAEGRPTTDPEALYAGGAQLPFGEHKGYALMLAVELLGRVFTGSDAYAEANRGGNVMRHQGVTMMAFRADLFQPLADFTRTADELESRVRAVPPAPGFDEVLVPGDLETRARATRSREGIPLPDDVWESLTDVASSLEVRSG